MNVTDEKQETASQPATIPNLSERPKNVSVFEYFTSELTRGYKLEREEEKYAQKRQRVYTFMKTPRELEKFCVYGFFQCVDAFLFVVTFLPLRILLAFLKLLTHPCGLTRSRSFLQPAQICDILKGIILVACFFIMSYIDTSMMYHIVRGQATIKLYVFFNMLDNGSSILDFINPFPYSNILWWSNLKAAADTADRLLSNFGHDILDALFWTATEPRGRRREHLGTLPHLVLAIIYVMILTMMHLFRITVLNIAFNSQSKAFFMIMFTSNTMLILFQATILNVAFNSYNKALLVIMMSNNFVEIKGSLFRKVDLNHLYTISCSDVKERFHYVILLSLVVVRNLTEAKWDMNVLWVLLPDALLVLIAELCVDWGKHAFILKFNEIPADISLDLCNLKDAAVDKRMMVYREYKVKLALDMAASRQNQAFTDHSDLVSRRMGLTPLPLVCLIFRILTKSIKERSWAALFILFMIFLCLTTFKVLNSIVLLGHSYKIIEEYDKEQQEAANEKAESETSNHSTEKSTNQGKKKSTNHSKKKSTNHRTQKSSNHSTDKSTNQTDEHNQTTNQMNDGIVTTSNENLILSDKNVKNIGVKHEEPPKIDDEKIENIGKFVSTSCDENMTRNFSDILMADSYTELTMVPNIDIIETSKDTSLRKSSSNEAFIEYNQNDNENMDSDNSSVEQLIIEKDNNVDLINNKGLEAEFSEHLEPELDKDTESKEFPIQESVFMMQSDKESLTYPKSERFFVDLSHRNVSTSKEPRSDESSHSNEMVDEVKDENVGLIAGAEDDHEKKD